MFYTYKLQSIYNQCLNTYGATHIPYHADSLGGRGVWQNSTFVHGEDRGGEGG